MRPLAALLLLPCALGCREIPPPSDVQWPDATDADLDAAEHARPDVAPDTGTAYITPTGGVVDRLHFAVFGDVRPPNPDDTADYPTEVFGEVMRGVADEGAQFAIGTGDYMFSYSAATVAPQLDLFQQAEAMYGGPIFHALGNHDCDTATDYNCTSVTATPNIEAFHTRLAPAYPEAYYDFRVHTVMGDAHFIVTAPNEWSSAQQSWLSSALGEPALYTFVVAHESPYASLGPGSTAIETAVSARTGGVTLRLYGHTHQYRHPETNVVIAGNGGAPLSGTDRLYGFVIVDQRIDGTIGVIAYTIGTPPIAIDSFAVSADGTLM